MKIKSVKINKFKRFTNLVIDNLPDTAKLIILVGPNGSGKSSLFEAFNHWYRLHGHNTVGKEDFVIKKDSIIPSSTNWYSDRVEINFHGTFDTSSVKDRFYFRTAYRNEPDFTIDNLRNQSNPIENSRFENLTGNDATVSENYQRLISQTLAGVFNQANNSKTVEDYREELIGAIRTSVSNVFDDLTLNSIGDPMSNGSFYFKKGSSLNFHYKNLSAGEKSAFDIILDLIIKSSYYSNAVFCIDEPEAHMHTKLQAKLLLEMFSLIPDNSQLWISTHSLGMLKQAEELEKSNPGSVVFLDFGNRDFDSDEVIYPSTIDKSIWNKFFELALDDFSDLIAPKRIVFCEGTSQGRAYKNFDSQVYLKIFQAKYYDTTFVSIGSCSEVENIDNQSIKIISGILSSSQIIKFVDRDGKSEQEVDELKLKGIKTLKKRHLESYLLDDEIIKKLCISVGQLNKIDECLAAKQLAMTDSIDNRHNPTDDVKSASGKICTELKRILKLSQSGNNTSSFLRDTMAILVTNETTVYRDLEEQIFQ